MAKKKIRLVPLGGLGEIGKNMMVIEYGGDILIVDAGLMFPDDEMLGVDLVIPDISYLQDKVDRIRGIVVTHGHEDHVGALPYVLPPLNYPPIYTAKLTEGLISIKLKEHRMLEKVAFNTISAGQSVELGKFRVEFFTVNHSIPDALGAAIHTPIGTVVHTGDYKFDHTPVSGETTDFGTLARLGHEGVLVLLGDSTKSEVPGYTPSEKVIDDAFDKIFANASGRVIVATFASLISRVQQVVDAAIRYDRKVVCVGRSMVNNVQMASELGYLHIPPETLIRSEDMRKYMPHEIAVVCTGSQGEPTSALTKMAIGEHKTIHIEQGDTVILSSTPVPGNEKLVNRTINNLYKLGAEVFYQSVAKVHVSGHGSQEELKLMLSLLQPRFFVPVHGEFRQLMHHAKLASSLGIPRDHIILAEDGDIIDVTTDSINSNEHFPCGHVYVDGLSVGDVGQVVLRDRLVLAQDGILMAVLTIDKETGKPLAGPDIISRGFIYMRDSQELLELARARILESLDGHTNGNNGNHHEYGSMKDKIKGTLSDFLYEQTKRRPMILPIVMEI